MIRKLFTLLTAVMTSATTWAQSTSDIGKVLAADGKMYKTVAAATNAGTTASGIIAYWGAAGSVESGNSSYRGMAIAIEDAVLRWGSWPDHTNYCSSDNHQCSSATSYCNTIWDALNAKNGIAATLSSRDRNGSGHWHNAPCNGYNVARPSGASVWVIPSVGQWKLMAQGLTGKSSEISTACNTDYSYDKLSAKITAVGGNTLGCLFYWSSTEVNASDAWTFDLGDSSRGSRFLSKPKNTDNQYMHVRMVFAFSSATAAVYTISYNANGGSGVPSAQTKDGGIDLTLSSTVPTRTGYAFAGWNTQADGSGTSYASGATFTDNANTTLYAQWTFQGSGSSTDPYLIPSADVWNYLADQVSAGNTYSGKYFQLTKNIGTELEPITRMIGIFSSTESDCRPFSGTFDGNGHTLTVNYSSNDYETRTALFSYVKVATIRNLIVAGNCGTAGRAASIVGESDESDGLNTVTNCVSSVTISGGLVGGIALGGNVDIRGCLFNGTINGTSQSGGIVCWGGNVTKITNCLFAPQAGSSIIGCTFYCTDGGAATVTNCYYTTALGTAQGKQARSISAGDDVTISNLGSASATYDVSGITAYSHGIKYNDIYYAGDGDAVGLNLSHADKAGYTFNQYTVTGGGSLGNPTTNTPTLTMTDANQTINAEWLENAATLSQATDNSTFISTNNGLVYDITLGRTMNAGGWNTFCVPFEISSSQIESVFGSGTEVRELDSSDFDEGTKALTLNFTGASTIEAGKPYLVYLGSGSNVVNPTFEDVTIVSGTTTKTTDYANFMPVMNPTSLTGGDKSILFVTGGDKLTYPSSTGNINGFRAYFQLHDLPNEARSFAMSFDDETTAVRGIENGETTFGAYGESQLRVENSYYDLQGRRVVQPTKGLYIVNGKKLIIK